MGLCGVRRGARREGSRRDGKKRVGMALFYVAEILAWRKTDEAAADGAGGLRIGAAEVAVFFVSW